MGMSKRPQYLINLVEASNQAIQQGHKEISVIEFGVAGGDGLVVLQKEAEAVENEIIRVYGFELGAGGLPSFIGDYREILKWMKKNLNLADRPNRANPGEC